ncbi:hypothetical protein E2320_001271 [Naja naja]|nr:hypothetical protein E2320_001271 [Naja naja]
MERVGSSGVSKWDIRNKIWDYMEVNNLADFPRPVHHRIPNFKGSFQMGVSIKSWDGFDQAREVKVDPDKPLEGIRLSGVRDYSVPIGLDAKVHVDLVVVGSVAVSEKGWRIGKGEGFADMEYAMMVSMGAVGQKTVVVDIPEELLDDHDLTISQETLKKIPVLKILHGREKLEGKDVLLKDEWPDTSTAGKSPRGANENFPEGSRPQAETSLAQPKREGEALSDERGHLGAPATVYVGNLSSGTRVSDLKEALRMHHVIPSRLSWRGAQHQAFLSYSDPSKAEEAITALRGLSLQGHPLRVEWSRNQQDKMALRPR